MKTKYLSRAVWILSLVSLFNDIASELLYPVMPLYLKSIGFSVVLIGVLEGIAEATAGISKGYFGNLSDRRGVRLPFVRIGYMLSAISKPMMAMLTYPLWIFGSRTMDKFGKGVRTAARDALLSDEARKGSKGRVFGFHRAMDTTGAVLGPMIALIYLYYEPGQYKSMFYLAFFPGIIAVLLTFFIKEKKRVPAPIKERRAGFLGFLKYWKQSPANYKKLTVGLLFFALFNSSDYFLLLKIKDSGLSDVNVIQAYIFYNIVYAIFSYPLGILADKIGLKNVLFAGFILYAIVYGGMALGQTLQGYVLLFLLYGIYAAATEGISKAWISNICEKKDTATAIGTFTGLQSICTMIASALAGWIWYKYGAGAIFITSAMVTIAVVVYLMLVFREPNKEIINRLE